LYQDNNSGTANRSFGNVQFDYKLPLLPALHAIWNLGYDVSQGKGTNVIPADAAQSYFNTPGPGYNGRYLQKTTNTVSEFSLRYNQDISAIKSNINATAGYGFYNNLITNYNYPGFDTKGDTITGTTPLYPFDKPENTLISYYGRLIYTFSEKYILTASIRTDGSSRFAPNDRWGVFPALALAWEINRENFLKNDRAVSLLKLRLSYGVTGNQEGIGNYGYLPDYYLSQNSSKYQFGNTFYNMATPALYVPDLTWEQTASSNVGIDYGFWDNRVTGSIDYYYKKTKNLLDYVFIPVGSNFSNEVTTNIGNMTSQGVEFDVNAIPVQKRDFTWNIGFNIAYNKIRITHLRNVTDPGFVGDQTGGISGATGQSIQINTVGYNPFAFFVFKQVYDPKTGKPIEGVYEDLNRDGVINQKDQYRYKSPFAPVIFGFSTRFNYKSWSLSMVMRANVGNYMYNNVASNTGVQRQILNPLGLLVNATTDVLSTNFYNNQFQSDYYVQNASFLKMDNIGIGYTVLSGSKLSLRLNAYCQNVFVITKYKGLDPEIYSGIDNNFYPRPRIFTLGANLGF
ncbi:MAG TPA: TonB-dependent receptor, partial [Chitinophagaceae bacterium]